MVTGEKEPGKDHIDGTIVKNEGQVVAGDAKSIDQGLYQHEEKVQVVRGQSWPGQQAHIAACAMGCS